MFETTSFGRAAMLDQPEWLADKLLEATKKVPFQPGWEVSSGSCVTSNAGPHGGAQLYER